MDQSGRGSGGFRNGHEIDLPRQHLREGAPLSPCRKRGGAKNQAIGLSNGAQATRVHALTETLGLPYVFDLTPGHISDVKAANLLLRRAAGTRYLIADKGYDADAICKSRR